MWALDHGLVWKASDQRKPLKYMMAEERRVGVTQQTVDPRRLEEQKALQPVAALFLLQLWHSQTM